MTVLRQIRMSTTSCLLVALFQASHVLSSNSLFCYYGTWAQWRLPPRDIDPFLCTHILVGFADISIQGRESTVAANITTDEKPGGVFAQLVALKTRNPALKVLLAVGGYSHGPERFHAVSQDPALLGSFVKNTVNYLLDRGFDGIDIDWEYPNNKPDYTRLLQAFRSEIARTGGDLLLVSAVSAGGWIIDRAYDVPVVQRLLDHVLLMAYDMHGLWGKPLVTGHNSPLYPRDDRPDDTLNLQWAANTWVSRGTAREKLVIGMPAYGRMFPLKDPGDAGVGSPAEWWAPGFIPTPTFLQICSEFLPGASVSWDSESNVPFASKDSLWLSFDNQRSLTIKAEWIVSGGFSGAMVWSMDNDDFGNVCGMGYSPLVNAVKFAMTRRPSSTMPLTQPVTPATLKTTAKPTTASGFDCATEGSNSYHIVPGDCSRFVHCVWGKPRIVRCPRNLYFTSNGSNCNWKAVVRPARPDCDWTTVS